MKNFKLVFQSFSRKNSKFVEELNNTVNNIKIEKKHVFDNDFDNKNNNDMIFDLSDTEEIDIKEEKDKKSFDFGKLEKRNSELNKNKVDDPAIQQLKNMIAYDENRTNKMEFKDLDLEGQGKSEAPIENEYLVRRPSKNFVWGLGQQTKHKKCINIITKSNSNTVNTQQ
jgi:hypothetical protein